MDCKDPVVTATILDTAGKSLAQSSFSFLSTNLPKGSSAFLIIVLILVAICIVGFVLYLARKHKLVGIPLLFVVCIVSGALLGGQPAQATTFHVPNGSIQTLPDGRVAWVPLANGDLRSIQYTLNLDDDTYSPNERIIADGRVEFDACFNIVDRSDFSLTASINGHSAHLIYVSGGSAVDGGGTVVTTVDTEDHQLHSYDYSGSNATRFNAPANPGQYLANAFLEITIINRDGSTIPVTASGDVPYRVVDPSAVNDASCTSFNMPPATVTAGAPITTSFVLSNLGNTTWTTAEGYQLVSHNEDPNDHYPEWGIGQLVLGADTFAPPKTSVPPGQNVVFKKTFTAPTEPGTYLFSWGMAQSGNAFGGSCTKSVVVSASCVPTQGTSCTSTPNSCGATQSGTVRCDGSCSATSPATPAGLGISCFSFSNVCGQIRSNGTIQCNGSCSSTPPPLPAGFGTSCNSAPNACGQTLPGTIGCTGSCSALPPPNSGCVVTPPSVSIDANPARVPKNGHTSLRWTVTNATSCDAVLRNTTAMTGATWHPVPDSTTHSVSQALIQDPTSITTQTVYRLTCYNGSTSNSDTANVIVNVVPDFQEF